MVGDNLFVLLAQIKDGVPEVSDAAWDKIKALLSQHAGTEFVYVPRAVKRAQLELLASADEQVTSTQLSQMLGVSVRHARRLKRLR